MFLIIFGTAMSRLFSKKGAEMIPSENESVEKRLLNRIIGNTLEQSFIFVPTIMCYILQ